MKVYSTEKCYKYNVGTRDISFFCGFCAQYSISCSLCYATASYYSLGKTISYAVDAYSKCALSLKRQEALKKIMQTRTPNPAIFHPPLKGTSPTNLLQPSSVPFYAQHAPGYHSPHSPHHICNTLFSTFLLHSDTLDHIKITPW